MNGNKVFRIINKNDSIDLLFQLDEKEVISAIDYDGINKIWVGTTTGMGYYDIAENTELLEYLKEKYKQGKVDILLHGYSHEYQLSENKWLAEMKWKSSSQLKEEIPKGKNI